MTIQEAETFSQWADEAHAAGLAAASKCVPEPMRVTDGIHTWDIPDGPCGFAWVRIKGNTAFGRWAKSTSYFSKSYSEPGLMYWISAFGQSVQLKSAYAYAYAASLRSHGIGAYASSRLD